MTKYALSLLLTAFILTGCIGGSKAPDASRVIAGPNLALPPSLRLPTPDATGIATPAERTAAEANAAAQEALLGTNAATVETTSAPMTEVTTDATSVDFLLTE